MPMDIFWAAIQCSVIAVHLVEAWSWFSTSQSMVGGMLMRMVTILLVMLLSHARKEDAQKSWLRSYVHSCGTFCSLRKREPHGLNPGIVYVTGDSVSHKKGPVTGSGIHTTSWLEVCGGLYIYRVQLITEESKSVYQEWCSATMWCQGCLCELKWPVFLPAVCTRESHDVTWMPSCAFCQEIWLGHIALTKE